jgi:hypothetical protein
VGNPTPQKTTAAAAQQLQNNTQRQHKSSLCNTVTRSTLLGTKILISLSPEKQPGSAKDYPFH